MLNETLHKDCRRLREDFEPRRPQDLDAAHRAHLASCESCSAWTTRLGEALALAATQEMPMPAALGASLRKIGRRTSTDAGSKTVNSEAAKSQATSSQAARSQAARSQATRSQATRSQTTESGVANSEAAGYETKSPEIRASLDAFLGAPQQPLPPQLKLRLRKIVRPKPLPIWLRDPRWVSAACVLLTILSMPLLGTFGDDAARLATVGSYRSGEVLNNVKGTVMGESRERLQNLREEKENLQQQALDLWSASWPQSWSPSWPQTWIQGSEKENTGEDHGRE